MDENNTPLKQRDDETDFQYHKRLINGKLDDKTLADYDYSELSGYVYGKEYSTDVARRMMYGSKRTLDLMDDLAMSQEAPELNGIISDIDRRMMDLRKEQQKFYDQRRELNKILAKEARGEHIDDILREAVRNLDIEKLYPNDSRVGESLEDEAVLVFSDWHYGMVTNNIFNTYNTAICKERVQAVVNNAIDRIMLHKCKKLHVILLGDFMSGGIHLTARVSAEELVVDQLMHVSEILAQSINELSGYVDSVDVYTTYGNHGRAIPNKKDSIHHDNLERIIGWWLNERLSENKRVRIIDNQENEFVLMSVMGRGVCAVHGDIDGVKTSPRLLTTLFSKTYGFDVDCIILGDKHHRESFEELGVVSLICGCLCGADDYASDKRLYSEPNQLLLIFNEDGLDAEYRLKCY